MNNNVSQATISNLKGKLFVLHDKLIGYGVPHFDENEEVAKRRFISLIENMKDESVLIPQDLTLYCIGDYSADGASLVAYHSPVYILSGVEVLNNEKV